MIVVGEQEYHSLSQKKHSHRTIFKSGWSISKWGLARVRPSVATCLVWKLSKISFITRVADLCWCARSIFNKISLHLFCCSWTDLSILRVLGIRCTQHSLKFPGFHGFVNLSNRFIGVWPCYGLRKSSMNSFPDDVV